MGKAADRATNRSSEALFGGFAAALGLAGAYALSISAPAAAFYITGPIAVTVGLPLGILAWRGPGRIRDERKLSANRVRYDEVMDRLHHLDAKAPDWVRVGLWKQAAQITDELGPEPTLGLPGGKGADVPMLTHEPKIALPPPTDSESVAASASRRKRGTKKDAVPKPNDKPTKSDESGGGEALELLDREQNNSIGRFRWLKSLKN